MATSAVSSTTSASTSTTSSASTPTMTADQIAQANKAAAQSLIDSLGAGSGVNVNSLATNLVAAEKTPLANAINAKISKNEAKISGFSAISYVVSQVQTAFAALKDQSSYNTLSVANSNTSSFDVTASTSASTGTHDVEVLRLARAQRSVSQGMASPSVQLNGGNAMSMTLTTGKGVSATISVVAGSDTPQGVVDAINSSTDAKSAGVTAQLVYTGDGSVAPYKVVLMGQQGAANSFSLSGLGNLSTGLTPSVATSQGVSASPETSGVTFTDLAAGQTVTLAGLTYTASATTTAAQVASAFANLSNGVSKTASSVSDGSGNTLGTLDGTLTGYSTGAVNGAVVTFTSAISGISNTHLNAQTGAVGAMSAPTAPAIQTTSGVASSTESSQVTFQDMSAGQTVTVGGLTYTATDTTTAAEVASAFTGIQAGGALPTGLTKGVFSGALSGFNASSAVSGAATLTFSSTTSALNVADIVVSTSQTVFLPSDPSSQTAVDAQVKVDGISYTRSNNTLTDVVKGATFNLKSLTPSGSPASIQLTRDNTAITTNINTLVTSYNDAISMLNVVSDPKSTVATYGATLVGDSTVRMVKQQLKSIFFGNSSTPGTSVSALWQMGISVDQTGVLSADSTKLTTALSNNYDDVVKTLTGNQNNVTAYGTTPAGIAGDAYRKLDKLLSSTGPLMTQSSNATTQNTKYQSDLTKLNTRMDSLLTRYQKQFATMNSLVGKVNSQKTSLKATFDGMMASYTGKTG